MSNQVNTELLERAGDMLEYWAGTMFARLLNQDIKNNDMESLAYHLRQAEDEMHLQEDFSYGQ